MTHFDAAEIAKFNRLAEQWWDPKGPCQPLHALNPLRLQFIQQHMPIAQQQILDVGCGGGILSEALASQGAIVTGIDQAEDVLQVAKEHAKLSNLAITYQLATVESLAQVMSHHFDAIVCMEMLEHVPQPENIIAACAALVKPKGYLFFSTLNRNLKSYLTAIIGAEYLLKLLPRGTHDYQRFIQPQELQQWARAADLDPIAMQGLRYRPFTGQHVLTEDVSVNYLAAFRKI